MDRITLGRHGEDLAAEYLEARGWIILGRNVRRGRQELDIIAARGRVLAFVEVKSRRDCRHGHPMEAITWAKRREVVRAAREWLRTQPLAPGTLVRFDAISVLWSEGGEREVLHIPDAWRLG
jgi:putative endonuclease